MDGLWRPQRSQLVSVSTKILIILWCASRIKCDNAIHDDNRGQAGGAAAELDNELKAYVDQVLSLDEYNVVPGIAVELAVNASLNNATECCQRTARKLASVEDYARERLGAYAQSHVLSVNIPATARFFFSKDTGKSSFLTGFGMGFLAFMLKKLLLPVFIGAQLVKSVLIAMFLPSLLGSLGKLVGKGLSTFSGVSGASAGINNNNNNVEDFEFKDTSPYNNNGEDMHEYAASDDALSLNVASSSTIAPLMANSRYGIGNQRVSYVASPQRNDNNYYMRKPNKKTDYKVFHKIPSSSMLLTSYDPFYSPLLSRLDVVFQQLGLGSDKTSPETELCRERLVCMMYANPAKYAPYSNLVSAQLSRELNELRKPSSDNPEILRFFRYMRAAKNGQDGVECLGHGGCPGLTSSPPNPAIITTYNDINKLVLARKLK